MAQTATIERAIEICRVCREDYYNRTEDGLCGECAHAAQSWSRMVAAETMPIPACDYCQDAGMVSMGGPGPIDCPRCSD